jgi:hypothetical protein
MSLETTLSAPGYLVAADNHNIAASGFSWFSPDTWGTQLGNIGKFISTSILSGANSFYNTAASVGSWLGADIKQNDTAAWISSIDSDFGMYYRANQESVDLAGFIGGAIIPGLAGIRAFNMGQKALAGAVDTGLIGGNLSKATGLLLPNSEKYVRLAAAEINASTTATKLLNTNTTKALANGLWQNTLEAVAFETAVQATMFKSPVLEQQDIGDMIANIAVGGAIGGAFFGIGTGLKLGRQIKEARTAEDLARKPFEGLTPTSAATSLDIKITQRALDADQSAIPVAIRNAQGEIVNNFDTTLTLYNDKINRAFLDIRDSINTFAGNNTTLGNLVADISTPLKNTSAPGYRSGFAQTYYENFAGTNKIVQAFEDTPAEIAMRAAIKASAVPEKEVAARWVKLIGDKSGDVQTSAPSVPYLGDLFKGKKEVLSYVRTQGFTPESIGQWNVLKLTGANAWKEAEARYIWAEHILKEIPEGATVQKYDIPILERAYKEGRTDIKIVDGVGPSLEITRVASRQELLDVLKEVKEETAFELLRKFSTSRDRDFNQAQSSQIIERITNTKINYFEGTGNTGNGLELFAKDFDANLYAEDLAARGLKPEEVAIEFLPRYAKVVYQVSEDWTKLVPNVVDAITYFEATQKLFAEGAARVTANILGPLSEQLPNIRRTELLEKATREGAGPGLLAGQNSNYGSLGATVAQIGAVTKNAMDTFRTVLNDSLEGVLTRAAQTPEIAIEFESLNQKISRTGKLFVLRETSLGNIALVDRAVVKNAKGESTLVDDIVDYEMLQEGVNYFEIKNEATLELIKAHISQSGKRTDAYKQIHAQLGKTDVKDGEVFRPIRPDLKDYPHFAFVLDSRVTGTGHKTMLHAATEKDLAQLIDKARQAGPQYTVLTKADVEAFKKARHEYEYSRSLHENYIDSDLANRGVFSNFFPKSSPDKIVNDILQQHYRESDTLVRETIRLRYEQEFNFLEDVGRIYSKAETSVFAGRVETLEKTADNPYFNYIKTALNISKLNEYPLIFSANKLLDSAVSRATAAISDTWKGVRTPEELDKINAVLDQFGMKPAYYDATLNALANHTAPRGALTKFVREANSLLSLFTLGLDPLNALNNAIGSNILRMTELKHVTRAINEGNTAVAGELAAIGKIAVPGVENAEMLAPTKLVANAISAFWKDSGELVGKYKDMGLIKDRIEQLKLISEDFTLRGTETVAELNKRTQAAFSKAKKLTEGLEKATGNPLAEEFNRFISANVMDQLTGIAVRNGIMEPAEALAYINTFVNRVEGNLIASQRPLIFQGPIGQAIGLFQSYQFNLIQQTLRYVAEGSAKDIAMLAGLQSTLYGIQSLPAFQFMNVHILGQLSGNQEHKDTYDAVYGALGRTAGDFVLYGLPSNMWFGGVNIYSRGDVNPRQITVLPTTLQEIPIVQGWGKLLGSIWETSKKIAGGGAVTESILQGLEHNGISRPLAGFAQVLQGFGEGGQVYSTSSKGSILYSNDLLSFMSLTRLAGGRPLDEAVVNDAMFRVKAYEAARRKDMLSLAERVKGTLISGNEPTEDQIAAFAERYAYLGGKQSGFNRWMMDMYKSANVPQAQIIANSLSNPFVYKMQLLMGGEDE